MREEGTVLNHARQRALERYNIKLSKVQLHALVDLIQRGIVVCRWDTTHGRTENIIRVGKKYFHVIYCPKSEQIVTFLPPNRIAGILISRVGTDSMIAA